MAVNNYQEVLWIRNQATDSQISEILTQRDRMLKHADEDDKRVRSEVLAAASHALVAFMRQRGTVVYEDDAREFLRQWPELQAAASDLEELLEQAHETSLPHAAEQLLKSLTPEGGEFAVGSPLAKVRQRVEELLREEREKFFVIIRRLTTYVDAYGPRDHINGAATKKLVKDARALTELEKVRASEGKG